MSIPWPPTHDDFFLDPDPHRPFGQGDIFRDVPYTKVQANPVGKKPLIDISTRTVALLNYPCEAYETGALLPMQTVAVLRTAADANVTQDWFQRSKPPGALHACPLPELYRTSDLHVVDWRTANLIDTTHLRIVDRVASLTEFGLAFFRQRLAAYFTRARFPITDLLTSGHEQWMEIELWREWNARGGTDFQRWLSTFDPNLGSVPRDLLRDDSFNTLAERMRAATPTA